jgi:two-component system NtrC family sensor kinase
MMDNLLKAYEELADLISLTDVKVSSELQDIFDMFTVRLQRIFDVHAIGLFLYEPDAAQPFQGSTNLAFDQYVKDPEFARQVEEVYQWVLERGTNVFFPSEIEPGLNDLYIPLTVFESKLGILHIITPTDPLNISRHQNIVLTIFAAQISKSLQYLKAIRQEKEAYEQQLQQEKINSLGFILAGVIHEINSPLTSIAGYNDLVLQQAAQLSSESAEVQKVTEFGQMIARETVRALGIVKSLLRFVRKQESHEFELLSPNAVITGALELLQYEFKMNQIEVSIDLAADLPWVMGDTVQLQQVFFNVLSNGGQALNSYMEQQSEPRPKRMEVRTWFDYKQVCLSIRDNGGGISPENIKKIFDPFFTTKGVGKGTGLGLSLCFKIMNEHGGKIWAENHPQGGAAFYFSLPYEATQQRERKILPEVVAVPLEPLAPASGSPARETQAGRPRILVIDDESTILSLIETVLSMMNYDLTLASSGQEACAHIREHSFDLILADMHLQDINGEELFAFMQTHCPEAIASLIFLTGASGDKHIARFLAEHGLRCLYKPFYPKDILATVQQALAR